MTLKKKTSAVEETEAEQSANERDVEEIKKAKEGSESKDEPILVDPDELDDDDEEEEKPSRDEKKRLRYREQAEARATAERERDEERATRSRLEEENRLYRMQLTDSLARINQPRQADPIEDALKGNKERQEALLTEFEGRSASKNPITVEEQKKFRERMQDLNREEMRLVMKQEQRGNGTVSPQYVEQQAVLNAFAQRYPDVMASHQARQLVQAEENALLAMGRPKSWATIDEAVKNTRKRLGLRSDTPDVRQRFAGTRSSTGGGGGGSDASKVAISKHDLRMAREAWPKLTEKQRLKKIAETKRLAMQDAEKD